MSTISRRAFLKTVGVGALSVAAMSVLAGCEAGTTEEVVTGTVAAKAGQSYPVAEKYIVKVASTDFTGAKWEDAFTAALGNGWSTENTADKNKEAVDKAVRVADNTVSKEFVKVTVSVTNQSNDYLVYANKTIVKDYAVADVKDLKSNSTVFTATCNGETIPCEAGKWATTAQTPVVANNTSEDITCYIAAPANFKELSLKVTLGGKALVYTIENTEYVDLSKY